MSTLKKNYKDLIMPKLMKEFKYTNIHQVPRLEKIQLNSGFGLKAQNKVFLQHAIEEFRNISGQQPVLKNSKCAIAGFKIRKGIPIGLTVTLRRDKMYSFLERLIKLSLPRIRDFRGLNPNSFDERGNYNFGIKDQLIFPEISLDNVDSTRGFNVTIVSSARTQQEGLSLLKEFGMPFTNK
jgi:large subunit ribosomal protein L5